MSDSEDYSSSSDDDSSTTTSVVLLCSNKSCSKEFSSSSKGCSSSRQLCAACNGDVIKQSEELMHVGNDNDNTNHGCDDDDNDNDDDNAFVQAGSDDFQPDDESDSNFSILKNASASDVQRSLDTETVQSQKQALDDNETSNDTEAAAEHEIAIAALFANLDTSISFDLANRCVTFVRKKFKGDALRRTDIHCYLDNELEDLVDPMYNFISVGVHYNKRNKVRSQILLIVYKKIY